MNRTIFRRSMHNITYLETSAVNVLADEIDDPAFLQYLQRVMKVDLCVSAVVLWEILLNSTDNRREKLLLWLQQHSADYLLKSPTELVVAYLVARQPKNDKGTFWFDRKSTLPIAKVWKDIHGKPERTINVDIDALRARTEPIRDLSKMHKGMLDAMSDQSEGDSRHNVFHSSMMTLLERLGWERDLTQNQERRFKTTLILAFYVLCIGIELDHTPLREFWSPARLGVDQPFEKLDFLIAKHSHLFVRGPSVEMMLMVEAQTESSNTSNRGTLFDSLHTIYCYYADNVVSNDRHFLDLKEQKLAWFFNGILSAPSYVELIRGSHEIAVREALARQAKREHL